MTLAHLTPAPDEPPFDPDYDTPQQPPQDLDAETGVLGSLLLNPTSLPDVTAEITATDFYQPKHATLFDTIVAIAPTLEGDLKTDQLRVLDELRATGNLQPGRLDAPYLHTLYAGITVPNAAFYATRVRDAARLRTADDIGTRLKQLAAQGHTSGADDILAEAIQVLDDAALRFGPLTTTGADTGRHDLAWILTGEPPTQPPPAWVTRADGIALFYPGKVNGIFGDPEAGKTWVAQTAIVEALNAGQNAAMIDADHNGPDHTAARLLLLGAHPEHIANPDRFRYYEPEDADQLKAAVTELTTWAPAVVLIDSLGEILPMLSVKSVDNDEITAALRLVCTPLANAGSCVITIDHLPKSAEARITGYAIGGTAKKRIMRGSYIRAEMRTQPAPGQIGKITLRIEKDTVGELRKHTPGGYAGTFTLDSTQPHVTTWTIDRDDSPVTADGTFRPTHLMERISRHVEANDLCPFRDIKDAIPGKDKYLRDALRILTAEGFITVVDGPRRAKLHHSVAFYRELEDDAHPPAHNPPEERDEPAF